MRVLTVCQPYAHAIIHMGKDVENRRWFTGYRGPLAIHAGKSRSWFGVGEFWPAGPREPTPQECVFGAIIGLVDLVGCVDVHACPPGPWREGPACWLLENPRPLQGPLLMTGQRGLWEVRDIPLDPQPPEGARLHLLVNYEPAHLNHAMDAGRGKQTQFYSCPLGTPRGLRRRKDGLWVWEV